MAMWLDPVWGFRPGPGSHLQEAAGAVVPKGGQAGPVLPPQGEGVGCHDNGLRPTVVSDQDSDGVVAEAHGVGHRPGQRGS